MKNQRKEFIDKQHKHIAVNTCWLIMITDAGPDLPQLSLYQHYNDEYIIVTVVYTMLNKWQIKQYGKA
jgi:hypothetical protein